MGPRARRVFLSLYPLAFLQTDASDRGLCAYRNHSTVAGISCNCATPCAMIGLTEAAGDECPIGTDAVVRAGYVFRFFSELANGNANYMQ